MVPPLEAEIEAAPGAGGGITREGKDGAAAVAVRDAREGAGAARAGAGAARGGAGAARGGAGAARGGAGAARGGVGVLEAPHGGGVL